MLLTIHDMNLRKVASIDNDKQGTLNYFNDLWTRYLETGSSTFDFTVFKKAIKSDTGSKKAYNYLNEKSFISFEYEGETHLFTVRKVVENENLIKCNCVNLNLELINEYADPYKATKAMTFKEYCQAMDLLNFTMLTIGLNELSDNKVSAEWEGADTKLARLLSLASKFGAELEFKTFLNDDSTIKQFVVNVYQAADGSHLGVGKLHAKPLRYGKDFKTLTRTVDKTEIYNMVRPTGKDDQGNVITIGKLGSWSVKNDRGELEFYQDGESLYAPLSMQMYPAAFTSGTMKDQWIRKDMTVESSSPEVIRATAYRELKKYAYPAVTYELEGFTNLGIGDTVHVYDDGFSPALLLEMRVSEQSISFTNKANNKTVFSNARALEIKLSQGIQDRIDQMLEDAKPYTIKLATDNGVIFKNQTGQTTITPTLYKGGKIITDGVTWRWKLNGQNSIGPTCIVKGSSVIGSTTLTVSAFVGSAEVAVDELSLVNVSDGQDGAQGPKGDKGGKGDPGQRGLDGLQGPKGDQGVPGARGVDGKTSYTHVAYANSADGRSAFSTSDSNRTYIGVYVDQVATDSADPARYKWTLVKGADGAHGIPGAKGADGRTPYFHTAYANSENGVEDFSITDSSNRRYIGTYTDHTEKDSQDPSKYKWVDVAGSIEIGGRNLLLRSADFEGWLRHDSGATISSAGYSGQKAIVTINGPLSGYSARTNRYQALVPSAKYTFSVWVFVKTRPTGCIIGFNQVAIRDLNDVPLNRWTRVSKTFNSGTIKTAYTSNDVFYLVASSGDLLFSAPKLEYGTVATDSSPAPEEAVYKTDIAVTNEGIVHSASKTVNGQTIASMIAQRAEWVEIIAQVLKVKADMIVDGAITADKLDVKKLSAIISDLGEITAGSLIFSQHFPEEILTAILESSSQKSNQVKIPEHTTLMRIEDEEIYFKGTPYIIPVAQTNYTIPETHIDRYGIKWHEVEYQGTTYVRTVGGSSIEFQPPALNDKIGLLIKSDKEVKFMGSNYTNWLSTGVQNCYYRVEGQTVSIMADVVVTAGQNFNLGKIPKHLVPQDFMRNVPRWTTGFSPDDVRKLQVNKDGTIYLLANGSQAGRFKVLETWNTNLFQPG